MKILSILVGVGAMTISLHASTSFDFNLNQAPSAASLTMTSGSLTVTETAYWANVSNSGSTVTGTTNKFASAWLGNYGSNGLGVCDPNEQTACSQPQHQVDNRSGLDFVLFGFNASVSLADVTVASFGNPKGSGSDDVDLSYAFLSASQASSLASGNLAFSALTFTTLSTNDLASNDYTLSGSGQYLLIGSAVTPYYGDGSYSKATADAFKIQDLTVTGPGAPPATTPEPASFLLIGSGLLAGAFIRRSRKNAA